MTEQSNLILTAILLPAKENGSFRLNPRWLRIDLASGEDSWECDTCARVSFNNIRDICPRNNCPRKFAAGEPDKPGKEPLPNFVRKR